METCGKEFRSEINKFRFLNELIKLVSKKFDGDKTPKEVSEKVIYVVDKDIQKIVHMNFYMSPFGKFLHEFLQNSIFVKSLEQFL